MANSCRGCRAESAGDRPEGLHSLAGRVAQWPYPVSLRAGPPAHTLGLRTPSPSPSPLYPPFNHDDTARGLPAAWPYCVQDRRHTPWVCAHTLPHPRHSTRHSIRMAQHGVSEQTGCLQRSSASSFPRVCTAA